MRPQFQDDDKTYHADTCGPLVKGRDAGELRFEALAHGHYPGRKLPRGVLAGVKSIGFWDADHEQNWGLDWHRNEGIELTFLERGSVGFGVEGDEHRLGPGDLAVTRPWQSHRVGCPNVGAGRLHWLILDVGVRRPNQPWRWPPWVVLMQQDLDELADILRHNESPVWSAGTEMIHCLQRIATSIDSDCEGSCVSRLAVHINEWLLLTLEMLRGADVPLDRTLSGTRRTVELLLADFRDHPEQLGEAWTARSLANRCGLGVTQFTAHCKQLTNMAPLQYVNHLRLDAAANLLVERPELSVTDVSMHCGFGSSQYFATVFRKRFRCTPKSYRASHNRAN